MRQWGFHDLAKMQHILVIKRRVLYDLNNECSRDTVSKEELLCVKTAVKIIITISIDVQPSTKNLILNLRGDELSFKKSGSRKILVKFQGSRSLVFLADFKVLESCFLKVHFFKC